MECFYADGKPVIGFCIACGRALCREHAAEAGKQLACSGRHEREAAALGKVARLMVSGMRFVIVFMLVVGIGLTAFGVWDASIYGVVRSLGLLIFGITFVVFAVVWAAIERERL